MVKITIIWPANAAVLSLFLSARDVLPGGTSTPRRRKFHTGDVNKCLNLNDSMIVAVVIAI